MQNIGPNSPPPHMSPAWKKEPIEADKSLESESTFVPYSPIHGPIPSHGKLPSFSKRSGVSADAFRDSSETSGSVDMQAILYEIVLLEDQLEKAARDNRDLARSNRALKNQVSLQETLIRGFCARVADSKRR